MADEGCLLSTHCPTITPTSSRAGMGAKLCSSITLKILPCVLLVTDAYHCYQWHCKNFHYCNTTDVETIKILIRLVVSFPDPQQDGDRTSLLVNIDLNRQAEGGAIKIISKSATEQPTGIHIPFPLLSCGKSLGMKLAHRGWEFGSTDIILCI